MGLESQILIHGERSVSARRRSVVAISISWNCSRHSSWGSYSTDCTQSGTMRLVLSKMFSYVLYFFGIISNCFSGLTFHLHLDLKMYKFFKYWGFVWEYMCYLRLTHGKNIEGWQTFGHDVDVHAGGWTGPVLFRDTLPCSVSHHISHFLFWQVAVCLPLQRTQDHLNGIFLAQSIYSLSPLELLLKWDC